MSSSDLPKLWTEPQKLDTLLLNKVLKKSKFSKRFINVSWSPNQIFFTELLSWPILDTEKWLWNSEFWDLWQGCS